MRVLKYFYDTRDLKLRYSSDLNDDKIDYFVDSGSADNCIDRKSTSGYVIRMSGNVIYWKTRKQNDVSKCSTFAEYIALSEAVTELLYVRNLCNERFGMKLYDLIKIYKTNGEAISISTYGNLTKNSKHIEIQYHYVNEN